MAQQSDCALHIVLVGQRPVKSHKIAQRNWLTVLCTWTIGEMVSSNCARSRALFCYDRYPSFSMSTSLGARQVPRHRGCTMVLPRNPLCNTRFYPRSEERRVGKECR